MRPDPKPSNEPDSRPTAIDCPYCGVRTALTFRSHGSEQMRHRGNRLVEKSSTVCLSCTGFMFWLDAELVYPLSISGPPPTDDMPEFVKREYDEARRVAKTSPRSAAALLRLAIQKLVDELRPGKGGLDEKIGLLVEEGEIRRKLANMLDVVRVTGNNAVHPGQIDLNDEPERVDTLFRLVNAIVEGTIALDVLVSDAMASLPENDLKGIDQRPSRVRSKFNRRGEASEN